MSTRRGRWRAALVVMGLLVLAAAAVVLVRGDSEAVRWGEPVVSPDGRRVEVGYVGGECDRDSDVDVAETSSRVVLTVVVREPWPQSCSDVGAPRRIVAELEEPLGDRELVDGSRG